MNETEAVLSSHIHLLKMRCKKSLFMMDLILYLALTTPNVTLCKFTQQRT